MYRTIATLVALIAFVQAIESVSATEEYAMFEELYEKVFGDNSKPLEPEEARDEIKRLYELGEKYEDDPPFFDFFFVISMRQLELKAKKCDFTSLETLHIGFLNAKEPAIQPYIASLRTRLVECKRATMKAAVEYYSSEAKADKTGALAHFKESLADMPLELFVKHNFIETKDEKVSKALASVVEKKYDGECGDESKTTARPTSCWRRMTKSSKPLSFIKMFQDSVVEFCEKVERFILVPSTIQLLAYHVDAVGLLGQEVVDWAKVHHLCQQITSEPKAAAKVVYGSYSEGAKNGAVVFAK